MASRDDVGTEQLSAALDSNDKQHQGSLVHQPISASKPWLGASSEPVHTRGDNGSCDPVSKSGDSESHQEQKKQLAVADWSPLDTASTGLGKKTSNSASKQQDLADRAGNEQWSSAASSEATESGSEKDAAESYVSKARQQSQGAPAREVLRKRRPSPCIGHDSPRKAARHSGQPRTGKQDAEAEVTTAVQQIKEGGPRHSSPKIPTALHEAPIAAPGLAPSGHVSAAALQVLARLVQQQQGMLTQQPSAHLQSPFQGRPTSPGKAVPLVGTHGLPIDAMRTCFSETSADQLLAKDKKEQSALTRLPSIVATSTSEHSGEKPAKSNFTAVKVRASSGPLPVSDAVSMPSRPSNTATNSAVNIENLLGLAAKQLSSTPVDQVSAEPKQVDKQFTAPNPLPDLGAFGSIIHGITGGDASKGSVNPQGPPKSSGGPDVPPPGQQKCGPQKPQALQAPPLSAGRVSSAPPAKLAAGPPAASAAPASSKEVGIPIPGPDPRILDWVLGNRGSLRDKSKAKPAKAAAAPAAVSGFDRGSMLRALPASNSQPPKPEAATGPPRTDSDAATFTLRRPIPIRASDMARDGMHSRARSSNILEKLFAHGQGQATGEVDARPSDAAFAAHPALTAGDIGRVVQWAGSELALRDRKVRDAEIQLDEARKSHDAAMTAVGTEVARLKRGQAELAITHWNLQEALTRKDVELREKCKLVNQLSAGITEITQQGILAAKQAQHHRTESEALLSLFASSDASARLELNKLEEMMSSGSKEDALASIRAWKGKLERSAAERQKSQPPVSQ